MHTLPMYITGTWVFHISNFVRNNFSVIATHHSYFFGSQFIKVNVCILFLPQHIAV